MTTPKKDVSVFMDQRGEADTIHITVDGKIVLSMTPSDMIMLGSDIVGLTRWYARDKAIKE